MANFWRDREADAVSDYWNAVIVGSIRSDHTAAVPDIDLTLLATIARIRKGRQRHLPDPAFVDRLETTLMNAQVTPAKCCSHASGAWPRRPLLR
jgi:hypothetical protein